MPVINVTLIDVDVNKRSPPFFIGPLQIQRLYQALQSVITTEHPVCWRRLKIDHLEGFVPIEF